MTDTERTEREIVEELKKRFPPSEYIDWQIFPPNPAMPNYITLCKHCSGTKWSYGPSAPTLPEILSTIRSLPVPAETEDRTTLRELAGIADRLRGAVELLEEGLDKCWRNSADGTYAKHEANSSRGDFHEFLMQHPEHFTDAGQAGEGEHGNIPS